MPSHANCSVGICTNDKRRMDMILKRSNVKGDLKFHKLPRNLETQQLWRRNLEKGRKDPLPKHICVCSNHFVDGYPSTGNPVPTLFLTFTQNEHSTPVKPKIRAPPRKRATVDNSETESEVEISDIEVDDILEPEPGGSTTTETEIHEIPKNIPLLFVYITRESDVSTFTGFHSTKMFRTIFESLSRKAAVMIYWDGKRTLQLKKRSSYANLTQGILDSMDIDPVILPLLKPGPHRKLSLEQEFLMVMMKLRLNLLVDDLAFRFHVSSGKVSQIFITWIKLMDKELSCLIMWPSRGKIRSTLPECFRRLYPKVRTTIDCSEVFVDSPSSLEVQANLWSDYKHHCTVKFLIAITPNGAVSWISPLYGGRTSDIFIVRDSGFLKLLEPYDQVLADRGFKIKTDLASYQCTLCIPPSAAKGNTMLAEDVQKTSNIANVRIYVEQAIGRIKEFRILKHQQPLLHLPVMNEIVRVCGALVNLKRPLCE